MRLVRSRFARPAALGLAAVGFFLAASGLAGLAFADDAQAPPWRVGVSLLGEPRHTTPFDHFDYVNPDAPKGGRVRLSAPGSYDNFNIVPFNGVLAAGMNNVMQTLMAPSLDEPSTEYGEVADAVRYPADLSSVTFRLNPKARWQDGQPITPDDVIWSFEVQKEKNPQWGFYWKDVAKAEASGEHEVTFSFSKGGNRELPQILGQLYVLPKHWWLAKGPDGKPRDVGATSLEPPLGSGPYRVKSFEAGRSITYERVKDWWGADLPTAKGHYNFDEIRYDYFLNVQQLPEFFKSDVFDFRLENTASNWATLYGDSVPAIRTGRIVKQEFPNVSSGVMQAFAFNIRRARFQDPRVREAFGKVFDFEEMNRSLFFGLYARIDSYFAGLDLASHGLPQGKELEILDSIKDKVPPQVFTAPFTNPVNGNDEARRANFRAALALLKEAGWEIRNGRLTNVKTGETMTVEVLLDSDTFTKVVLSYQQSLKRIGVDLTVRVVDGSQYKLRTNRFDFDMIVFAQGQSQSPGNEQREYWGSAAADREASQNLIGIKDPAVDALIDRVIYAKDRDELVAATHALDRVLLAGNYVVPMWRSAVTRTLRWNRFGQPAVLPSQSAVGGFPDVWWWDQTLAAKTAAAK